MISKTNIILIFAVAAVLLIMLAASNPSLFAQFRYSKSLEKEELPAAEPTEVLSISPETKVVALKYKREKLLNAIRYVNPDLDADTAAILAESIVSLKNNSMLCMIKSK